MKGILMSIATGTLLLGACSTSDTTSRMYGRNDYKGAEVRVDRSVTEDDVYRGNMGNSGVVERRDISRDNRDLNEDTYTGSGVNNSGVNPAPVPDVNGSTGTGSGMGVNTNQLINNNGNEGSR